MSNTLQTNVGEKVNVAFLAIDPYIKSNIILPTEKLTLSKNMVEWGEKNSYPNYLLDLYNNVPTLRSIIDGNKDFICGDDISILPLQTYDVGVMNQRGDTIAEQVRDIAKDNELYGGFALQIIRNLVGEVSEVYYIDMRFLRTNKDCNVFYYSEKWGKSTKTDVITYPVFIPNLDWASLDDEAKKLHSSSILFVKSVHTQVYPAPKYAASIVACEIEKGIDEYHLNNLLNSFTPSVMINFNNGDPGDEAKEEITEMINAKFSGAKNSGRIMCSWNDNKDAQTTIREIKTEDFSARYDALSKRSRQEIFTAFRANPNLFGIPTENLGFSSEEYESSFKLYNRTQIRPIQRLICDAYDKIYGSKNVMTIKPFSLGGETETSVE